MSQNKLITRIAGGLGNQLFTYAAAKRLAVHNDMELIIDDVSGFKYDAIYQRSYQLNKFSISSRRASPAERMEPFSRIRRYFRKKKNLGKSFDHRDYIVQDVLDFDERLVTLHLQSDTYMEGYWQSENYFKDIEDIIRKELVIKPPVDPQNRELQMKIANSNAVAVHLRHFSKDNNAENLVENYYNQAISILRDTVKSPHLFIFSDNPDQVMKKLSLSGIPSTLVTINSGDESAYADLWLMQNCRHFIIANSTFSWWGAWLSKNKEKMVVAPALMKRTGVSWWGFEGLLPDEWIKI